MGERKYKIRWNMLESFNFKTEWFLTVSIDKNQNCVLFVSDCSWIANCRPGGVVHSCNSNTWNNETEEL